MLPTLKAHLAGLAAALILAPLTVVLCLVMNHAAGPPGAQGTGEVSFAVQPPPPRRRRPPAEPQRAPRRAPARSAQRVAPPPAPALGAALSGVDVGLEGLALEPVSEVSDEVLGDLDDVVHTEDTVDARPTPRVTTPIEVPAAARARNLSGRVVLSLRIGRDGAVRAVKVLEAAPPGVFEDVVLAAVRGWEFEPATYRGQAVEVWATLPIEFSP